MQLDLANYPINPPFENYDKNPNLMFINFMG